MSRESNEEIILPLCGIDEAGRGPLAGPLVMAGVILTDSIEGLTDSKKLSAKRREELYGEIIEVSNHHIAVFSHIQIDEEGISQCLHDGLEMIREAIGEADYLFDGNSTFGVDGLTTMVKADLKVPAVSAASILAKVTRDRMMDDYAREYPEYGFEKHKGYGTKAHIEAMKRHGRCAIHRKTFRVKALDEPSLF
ncbi:MAG: ribonuclease HII [Campylobacterota bacterium]|nr:ribonuclease HII [Campylobacterota bacterium]